jgi:hypothetical protein
MVATMAGLAALGRIAFAPVPNVKPTTDIVVLTGYVLGGISPQATIDFEARVHRVCQRLVPQSWNRGYPPMVVWYHRRMPLRVDADDRPLVPREIDPELVDAAAWLGRSVDFLVMPCNAAHVEYTTNVPRPTRAWGARRRCGSGRAGTSTAWWRGDRYGWGLRCAWCLERSDLFVARERRRHLEDGFAGADAPLGQSRHGFAPPPSARALRALRRGRA